MNGQEDTKEEANYFSCSEVVGKALAYYERIQKMQC